MVCVDRVKESFERRLVCALIDGNCCKLCKVDASRLICVSLRKLALGHSNGLPHRRCHFALELAASPWRPAVAAASSVSIVAVRGHTFGLPGFPQGD